MAWFRSEDCCCRNSLMTRHFSNFQFPLQLIIRFTSCCALPSLTIQWANKFKCLRYHNLSSPFDFFLYDQGSEHRQASSDQDQSSMLKVICSQRDRFRNRLRETEEVWLSRLLGNHFLFYLFKHSSDLLLLIVTLPNYTRK